MNINFRDVPWHDLASVVALASELAETGPVQIVFQPPGLYTYGIGFDTPRQKGRRVFWHSAKGYVDYIHTGEPG